MSMMPRFQLPLVLLVILPAIATAARKKRSHESTLAGSIPRKPARLPESARCTAFEKCRHLDGFCCPDTAGLTLDCCKAGDENEAENLAKGGKGDKHELKGRVEKTKDQGGKRTKPSEKMERFAEALDMSDEWRKAEAILKSEMKSRTDAADKAKNAMMEYTKDEDKFHKASTREKKGMLAAMLRELFENFEDERIFVDIGYWKQKQLTLKNGKAEFLKFFEPSDGKAKECLKDDIDVIEPADDAEGTNVELGKTSIYCSMDEGEVCTIFDAENKETIRIEKKSDSSGEFVVTRDGYVHDCGSHNMEDTTCGWDTPAGTRYLDFGSALLSGDDAETDDGIASVTESSRTTDAPSESTSTIATPSKSTSTESSNTNTESSSTTSAPTKSNSINMQPHIAFLSLVVASCACLM